MQQARSGFNQPLLMDSRAIVRYIDRGATQVLPDSLGKRFFAASGLHSTLWRWKTFPQFDLIGRLHPESLAPSTTLVCPLHIHLLQNVLKLAIPNLNCKCHLHHGAAKRAQLVLAPPGRSLACSRWGLGPAVEANRLE